MLANTLTLTDGTTPLDYDLISREGMNSIRRETSADSDVAAILNIKNTVDLSNASAKNRHLLQLQEKQVDGVTGDVYEGSVHISISRHKKFTDAGILTMLKRIGDLADNTSDMTDVLKGGN